MEIIKTWLISISCAAMVAALAEALTPAGTPKKIGRMAGGLLMLLAVLGPVKELGTADLSALVAQSQGRYQDYATQLEENNAKAMESIIAEQAGAYILDKAVSFGIANCKVEVTCEGGAGGFPIPTSVKIEGAYTFAQADALRAAIQADFAIPSEKQTWERTEGE